jgi:hypothetical protein
MSAPDPLDALLERVLEAEQPLDRLERLCGELWRLNAERQSNAQRLRADVRRVLLERPDASAKEVAKALNHPAARRTISDHMKAVRGDTVPPPRRY